MLYRPRVGAVIRTETTGEKNKGDSYRDGSRKEEDRNREQE